MNTYRIMVEKINEGRGQMDQHIVLIKNFMVQAETSAYSLEAAIRIKIAMLKNGLEVKEKELIQIVHAQK